MSELRRHMCPDCGREGDDAHLWCDACSGLTSFSRQMADDVYELEGDSPPPHDVTDAENMDAAWLFNRDFGTAGMEDDSDDIEYIEYDWDDDGEYGNTVYYGLDGEDDEGL